MPKITYESWRPGIEALDIVQEANSICQQYAQQGFDLTLRQLYYQFVARAIIPNTERSYKRLGDIINKARLAGMLDWNYITDRTRNLARLSHWDSPGAVVRSAANSYMLDHWSDQPVRVEVWVEKEALAGIVGQAAERWDCPWFSCRGYVSQSELWGAAQRLGQYLLAGQRAVVIHLGDHDPSGIDMTRDIEDRLRKFVTQDWLNGQMPEVEEDASVSRGDINKHIIHYLDTGYHGIDPEEHVDRDPVTVRRIALNMDQVEEYDPPPNPAKLTDSRATDYIDRFGTESWELDALEPGVLSDLIESTIQEEVNTDKYFAIRDAEEDQRQVLLAAARRWEDVKAFLENGDND